MLPAIAKGAEQLSKAGKLANKVKKASSHIDSSDFASLYMLAGIVDIMYAFYATAPFAAPLAILLHVLLYMQAKKNNDEWGIADLITRVVIWVLRLIPIINLLPTNIGYVYVAHMKAKAHGVAQQMKEKKEQAETKKKIARMRMMQRRRAHQAFLAQQMRGNTTPQPAPQRGNRAFGIPDIRPSQPSPMKKRAA